MTPPPTPPPDGATRSLDTQLRALLRGSAPGAVHGLMVEAFAGAGDAEQVRLIETADLCWLQSSVHAVLDDLDEDRPAAIDRLRTVLVPELEYLLLS